MKTPVAYTLPQIVEILPTTSVKTLTKAIKDGKLRAEKPGRSWIVTPAALAAYRTGCEYIRPEPKKRRNYTPVEDVMALYGA